ncbi:putative flagellar M-ring protein [Oceanicola granulosus HTCC2516]|uniref:Flagellar M-ring protein n=1 Tax=Oceanicola granulosus (strain ATCC BAA-861 / DSM 15982 / KCTC 12143 / HTCC2516) TaxID=314256 RepID=Q2CGI0_OCEGH|nr:flagellar basal-body MS-ring/collar protein FliF [Oceanicola granulosus]EAR51738.1 putative flagellar M-ring protein [Oceanicola granulosus HTCC2516]
MQSIINNLMSLGQRRLIALAATGIGLTAALLLGVGAVLAPTYAPLYSGLSPSGAAQVVGTLEQAGFRVDVSADGTMVSVPDSDLARARMALADQGLPDEGVPGWELFDNSTGLGMNSFMQRINRLRALEGELARSIQTIDAVDSARVHLVLPEREAFSRARPEPSASVIVRASGRSEIGRNQARAIRNLVAAAVPDLAPSRVTVLSASGETILADDGEPGSDVSLQSVRASLEDRMSRSIDQILSARVGAGNARVQVSVDLTTERQVILQQSYDPNQRVVRSTETRNETVEDTQAGQDQVDAAGNLPEALGGEAEGSTGARSNRTAADEIVNYEIGSTRSEVIREPGDVEKISVAVLVNGIYNRLPNGDVEYEERPPEEIERLTRLVESAVGYDAQRGDTVSVESLRFMDYSMELGDGTGGGIGQLLLGNASAAMRGLFAIGIVALVMLFGVRPLATRLTARQEPDGLIAQSPDGAPLPAVRPAEAAPGAPRPAAGAGAEGVSAMPDAELYDPLRGAQGEYVNLAAVNGSVQRNRLQAIGELVEVEPAESLRVLRTWLAQEA